MVQWAVGERERVDGGGRSRTRTRASGRRADMKVYTESEGGGRREGKGGEIVEIFASMMGKSQGERGEGY